MPQAPEPKAVPEQVEVVRIAPGGEGVARRASGEVLFVAGTAPGDLVEVTRVERKGGALRGQLLRVLNPAPERRDPPCPYAGRCGGCDFMHLAPDAQRRHKLGMLEEAFARVGGNLPRPSTIGYFQPDQTLGYRSRLRLHVSESGVLGLLSPRSHELVRVERCLIADETINRAIARLDVLDSKARKRLSFCEQIELRSSASTPTLAVRLFPRNRAVLRPEIYAPLFPEGAVVAVVGSQADNETVQSMAITPDVTLRVPFSAFSQVHQDANRALVRAVVAAAVERGHREFLDAYAGAGNFAIPLLAAGLVGEAVDTGAPGILAARALARDLGLPISGFNVGDARKVIEHFVQLRRRFDFVVLDPPRQGAKSVLDAVLGLHPRTIALVACDPVALARDLASLTARGSRIEEITLFDMFPETHHTETLAVVDCDE